jgi:acetyltransferase
MEQSVYNFFYPKSVCLIGVSSKPLSIGYEILGTLKHFNFKGKVFPVNPKAKDIHGFRCYTSIKDIKERIDLAIILVPKQFVLSVIDELLTANVKSIILVTAGFKETGKEGEILEKEIVKKIRRQNARLVGPNCMGVINTMYNVSLNATFIKEMPPKGKTAYMSQSGALGAMILNSLRQTDWKFAHFISVGNKADMNENDFLRFWLEDNEIEVLTYYLESFENGFEFIKPFLLGKVNKPTIILKAGRTKSGMKAASSHTGALSSEDKVVNALLKQAGIIRVETVNELFNTAKGFEAFPVPKGNRIAVVTNAGGPSILLTDQLEKKGLELAEFSDKTKKKLREIVHPEGSINNPVDLLPHGDEKTFPAVIQTVLSDPNVDALVSLFVEPVMVKALPVALAINNINSSKPVLQVIMPLPEFWDEYKMLPEPRKPIYRNPEEPAEVLSNMLFYSSVNKKRKEKKETIYKLNNLQNKKSISFPPGFIGPNEVERLCKEYKIPLVNEKIIPVANLANINIDFYPVVVKGISENVIHKSDLNAVKLNLRTKAEVISAAKEIEKNFSKHGITANSFLIQQFIHGKHEILLGGYRDKSFGPIIIFGSGGKYVEVLKDTAIRSAYISEEEIEEMILSTKMGKLLAGVRGEAVVNFDKLISIIRNTAKMIIEIENITEFDFNPVIVDYNNNFTVVDVRIKFG